MKITYTKHALKKFIDLKKLGFFVPRKLIKEIIENPLHVDLKIDPPKIIVSGDLGKQHILRVVHRKENDIIVVITFYPTKKGRYFT